MHKILSNKWVILSLVAPGMFIFLIAILAPLILSLYYGTTDYTGFGAVNFVGLDNFTNILTNDPIFWQSLLHAILLALCLIIFQHPLCMLFAIILDKLEGKLEKFFRVIFFIPCVISLVITAKMWISIFDFDYGLLNKVLEAIGLGMLKMEWLANPSVALPSVIFIVAWQGFGWGLLIYYAGIKGIPGELYEAASIDGATGFRVYTYITLPLLTPVISVNVTLAIISALKQMETIYLTTNGGPVGSTQFLANYLYIKAFNFQQYGYANAIAVMFVVACLLITFLCNRFIRDRK